MYTATPDQGWRRYETEYSLTRNKEKETAPVALLDADLKVYGGRERMTKQNWYNGNCSTGCCRVP